MRAALITQEHLDATGSKVIGQLSGRRRGRAGRFHVLNAYPGSNLSLCGCELEPNTFSTNPLGKPICPRCMEFMGLEVS